MSSPAAGKPEKTMSSRLLTMKRAAASAVAHDAQSGTDEHPPSPKRQRVSDANGPSTPQSDLDAISAALAAEEAKRRDAITRQAAEAGETEWTLDIPAATSTPTRPLVVAADSLDAEDSILRGGRRAYGNFERKAQPVFRPPPEKKGSDSDSDSDDLDTDPTDPATVEARLKRKKQKAIAKAAKNKAKNKPGKDRLSNLTSISGSQSHGSKKKKRKSQ
ncbi:hypothetical protein N7492_000047 [Penicillium capsulatum]|uniref:Uncharacterized protein n=1 Tax=Penicillium capsulatum TaxID=69766 RepID=A0A9W9IV42_9EURO|nr:hypothetical protein N7492_000047 [Penicillium capsulatum]KAJ6130881.1 hypothetical protein N7512_003661 [Penicillium capsulatum]